MQFKMTAALAAAILAFFAGSAQAQGSQLEAIRHSGNWKDYNPKGTPTPAKETIEIPKEGPFIMAFNGTNFTEIAQLADKNHIDVPFIFTNPPPQKKGKGEGFCVLAGASNLKLSTSVSFKRNDTNGMLYVPANSTALAGNFLNAAGDKSYNGRVQVMFGCTETCEKCAGACEAKHTLFEWMYQTRPGKASNDTELYWNLSNVDGYSANVNVTVYNQTMGSCGSRSTNATLDKVKKICPKANLWKEGKVFGCKSDCKLTGMEKHCCVGEWAERFGPKACRQSSVFLEELCPAAYSWPYGDMGVMENCYAPKAVHAVWTPIR